VSLSVSGSYSFTQHSFMLTSFRQSGVISRLQTWIFGAVRLTRSSLNIWKRGVVSTTKSVFPPFHLEVYTEYCQKKRWGDAPVHSIAAALFTARDNIHFFHDIGYEHNPYTHCPKDERTWTTGKCSCNPRESFGEIY